MAKKSRVEGLDKMKQNFFKATKENRRAIVSGLTKWGLLVEKDSVKNAPARLGNLRGSVFLVLSEERRSNQGEFKGSGAGKMAANHVSAVTISEGLVKARAGKNKIVVGVGHSAEYAIKVHELPSAGAAGYDPALDLPGLTREKVHSAVGGWKFLINALIGSRRRGMAILAEENRKVFR